VLCISGFICRFPSPVCKDDAPPPAESGGHVRLPEMAVMLRLKVSKIVTLLLASVLTAQE
jgi:hypothetical protein